MRTNQSILLSNTNFGYNHGELSKHETGWQTAPYWSKIVSKRLHVSIVWMMLKHKTCKFEENILILEGTLHYITHCHPRIIPSLPLQHYISTILISLAATKRLGPPTEPTTPFFPMPNLDKKNWTKCLPQGNFLGLFWATWLHQKVTTPQYRGDHTAIRCLHKRLWFVAHKVTMRPWFCSGKIKESCRLLQYITIAF